MKDSATTREFAEQYAHQWLTFLGFEEWKLLIAYTRLPDDNVAECEADPSRHTVIMRLELESLDDEEELKRTIRHEMFHVLHAEFHVTRRVWEALLPDQVSRDAVDEAFQHAAEKLVVNLERLFDMHNWEP